MPARRQGRPRRAWNAEEVAGGVAMAVNTVHSIYKFAIRQNSQITLKFL